MQESTVEPLATSDATCSDCDARKYRELCIYCSDCGRETVEPQEQLHALIAVQENSLEPLEQPVMLLALIVMQESTVEQEHLSALIAMQGSTVELQEQLHALIAVQENAVEPLGNQ